jgi:hypothetical protein
MSALGILAACEAVNALQGPWNQFLPAGSPRTKWTKQAVSWLRGIGCRIAAGSKALLASGSEGLQHYPTELPQLPASGSIRAKWIKQAASWLRGTGRRIAAVWKAVFAPSFEGTRDRSTELPPLPPLAGGGAAGARLSGFVISMFVPIIISAVWAAVLWLTLFPPFR